MEQPETNKPEQKNRTNETDDAESDDEFHDAHFPPEEEAVRLLTDFLLAQT